MRVSLPAFVVLSFGLITGAAGSVAGQEGSPIGTGSATPTATPAKGSREELEFFEKKIRPVLVQHCYKCHSDEKGATKGGLSLDTRDGLRRGGETGPAVVPGKLKESLLLDAIEYKGQFYNMPPSGKLPESVVADFRKWIEAGAHDPREAKGTASTKKAEIDIAAGKKFWSFQPLGKPAVPEVTGDWPARDLDRFVLAKLRANKLEPAADASREALVRRLFFDLLGLPPTPAQIAAFRDDRSPNAYEKLVDELLASPHYGERWGRHWLDVVRFAESTGGGRTMMFKDAWRFRDYVIQSFNADKPYSQLIREHLAGDLLPSQNEDERAQRLIASAFLILGPNNYEEQNKSALEMDVIDEQIDTLGKAFLGMTLGCARCHDHKFDPIPTRDYYGLAGVFKSTHVLVHDNVSKWVERTLPMSPELAARVAESEREIARLKDEIKLAKASVDKLEKAKPVKVGPPVVVSAAKLAGIIVDDEQAKRVGTWTHSTFHKSYIEKGYLHDGGTDQGQKTLSFIPELPRAGKYEVRFAYIAGGNRAKDVAVTVFHGNGEKTLHINQQQSPDIDGRFVSLGQYRFEANGQGFVIVSNRDADGHVTADAMQFLPVDEADEAAIKKEATAKKETPPKGTATGSKSEAVVAVKPGAAVTGASTPGATTPGASATKAPGNGADPAVRLKQLEDELKKKQASAPTKPTTMGVEDFPKAVNSPVYIRGNVNTPGPEVTRGVLQVTLHGAVPVFNENESGRRQVADWIASAENPLTARVMANRVWQYLLGVGIVRTSDNFGTTGELPSHPELLDHLAQRLVENGWSVKKLIREIVLSRTYRMSTHNPVSVAADPENRLLSRAHRKRLDAESIRDAILSVSGRLDRTMGGDNIAVGTAIEYGYKFSDTRRSVYTPVFRNTLPELFEVFDFADPNSVVGRRNVTTTAPQALFLMNSPFIHEQSRAAAKGLLSRELPSDGERLDDAYQRTVGRLPTPREREAILAFLNRPFAVDENPRQPGKTGSSPTKATTQGKGGTSTGEAGAEIDSVENRWTAIFQSLFGCVDFRYTE